MTLGLGMMQQMMPVTSVALCSLCTMQPMPAHAPYTPSLIGSRSPDLIGSPELIGRPHGRRRTLRT